MPSTIANAESPADFEAFAGLIAEYVDWCRERYRDDAWFVDAALSHQSLAAEVEGLAAKYSPPAGRALLARDGGQVVACGAYRWRRDGVVEMKRVFVPDRFKGQGHGRQLCQALIAAARVDGCHTMLLDTANLLTEAIALYELLGFVRRDPYNDYPPELMRYIIFMERSL